jgi:hypothetical protein
VNVIVQQGVPILPSFSFTLSASSVTISPTGSATVTITQTVHNGDPGPSRTAIMAGMVLGSCRFLRTLPSRFLVTFRRSLSRFLAALSQATQRLRLLSLVTAQMQCRERIQAICGGRHRSTLQAQGLTRIKQAQVVQALVTCPSASQFHDVT